ncbi:MAG: amidohydrolase, partial [Thaumarchaeota archaeon]|nr:amidohydrolase [Nitrososphaerota archaeon]
VRRRPQPVPEQPDAAGIQSLSSGLFKGVRMCPQYHGFALDDASNIADLAEDLRVPIVLPFRLILSWNLPTMSMGAVLSFVKAHPGVSFVLSGVNYDVVTLLYQHKVPENLWVETSCLQMWQGKERLIKYLGPKHVLLGTGCPVQYARSGVSNVVESTLPDKEKRMVASSNARELFRL